MFCPILFFSILLYLTIFYISYMIVYVHIYIWVWQFDFEDQNKRSESNIRKLVQIRPPKDICKPSRHTTTTDLVKEHDHDHNHQHKYDAGIDKRIHSETNLVRNHQRKTSTGVILKLLPIPAFCRLALRANAWNRIFRGSECRMLGCLAPQARPLSHEHLTKQSCCGNLGEPTSSFEAVWG